MMLNKKLYREAEPFFQKSMNKTPPVACDFINYGALLIETGRPQEALDLLEKARLLTMGHIDRTNWNNNMGAALTLSGNYKRAHEHFGNALALDPQNVGLNRNLAYLLLQEGRTEEATQRLKISEHIKRAQ
jgi:Tfp pilus assembly protein PilF